MIMILMNMINHDTIHRVHLGHTYTPYFLRIDFEIGMAAVEVWGNLALMLGSSSRVQRIGLSSLL